MKTVLVVVAGGAVGVVLTAAAFKFIKPLRTFAMS